MALDSTRALAVTVVAADGVVWEGEARSIVARTTEGDIGILPNHEPMLAALVPCGAEIVANDGQRLVVAVDGGFISVADNRVSLLSQYARLSEDISGAQAEQELEQARAAIAAGDTSDETQREHDRAEAEVRAARKAGGSL